MKEDKFKSLIAVLIAVITVLGASAACLSAVAVSNASDADFAGIDASLRAEKADIINNINAYADYRAYTEYVRYNELGYLLFEENGNSGEAWGLADGLSFSFFNARYLNSDSTYNLERNLQESFAQDGENEDLNAEPYFVKSKALRENSLFLSVNMIVFAVSFWFLTLAQAAESKIKYVWLGFGALCGLAGIIGLLIGGFIL